MKINKILKIILIILILITISLVVVQSSYAWEPQWNSFETPPDKFETTKTIIPILSAAINVISIIGVGIAVIMLIVLGINFVLQSPAGKAETKKDLVSYSIGIFILFGASGLLKLVQIFINSNFNGKINTNP